MLLTRTATEQALPSLLGMALDYAPTLDRHDARRKVGIITRAELLPAMKASLSGRGSPSSCNAGRRAPHRALAEELRAGAISNHRGNTPELERRLRQLPRLTSAVTFLRGIFLN